MSALLPVDAPPEERDGSRAVPRLLAATRRRWLAVALVEQLALVASVLFGGLTLALLFGTAIVSILLVALATLLIVAFVLWRLRKSIPSSYSAAQKLDRELRLHDTLSTAWFLLEDERARYRFGNNVLPIRQAGLLAGRVDPRSVFHWRGRNLWILALALALTAAICFRARYLVQHSLDLRRPLVSLPIGEIVHRVEAILGTRESEKLGVERDRARKDAHSANGNQRTSTANEAQEPQLPPRVLTPDNDGTNSSRNSSRAENNTSDTANGKLQSTTQPNAKNGNPESQSGSQDLSSLQQSNSDAKGSPQKTGQNNEQGSEAKAGSPPGLINKLREAFSSMLARMSNPNSGQKANNAGDPSSRQGNNPQQPSNSGQPSAQQQNGSEDQSAAQETPNGEANGQSADKTANSSSRSSGQSQDRGNNSQSGVGSQDGDKQLREAEQQQAMGKLAEILGKRSATLTGEMTVETPTGNQKLKTDYTQQQEQHVDSGGEINRNEVPARYRRFVEDYMEQVRKTQNAPLDRGRR